MPTLLKVLLVVGIVIVLGIVAVVAGGYYFYKQHGQELVAGVDRLQKEGQQLGEGKPAESCVKPALDRAKACDGIICEAQMQIFLTSCVANSVDPRAVCAGAPEGMFERAKWVNAECVRRGYANDQVCIRLVNALAANCAGGSRPTGTQAQ